jgi:hypothetical protein
MIANKGLTVLGWALLGVVALMAVCALTFGFSSLFYFAIFLVPVAFVLLLQLCGGKLEA